MNRACFIFSRCPAYPDGANSVNSECQSTGFSANPQDNRFTTVVTFQASSRVLILFFGQSSQNEYVVDLSMMTNCNLNRLFLLHSGILNVPLVGLSILLGQIRLIIITDNIFRCAVQFEKKGCTAVLAKQSCRPIDIDILHLKRLFSFHIEQSHNSLGSPLRLLNENVLEKCPFGSQRA